MERFKKHRILLTLCLLLLGGSLWGQSLQFSRVVNLKGFAAGTVYLDTVPAGKVWKLENVSTVDVNLYLVNPGAGQDVPITASNDNRPISPLGSTALGTLNQPYWLKEGEILKATGGNNLDVYHISIIEFSVVP